MLSKILLVSFSLFTGLFASAKTIVAKNIAELNTANKEAKPGDTVVLRNGEWNNVVLALNCNGTKEQPIVFKAEQPGRVTISGHSKLKLGGTFITVDGLLFTNGYSGTDAVITFRVNKNEIARNCRVTNTVIDNFNNPKRLDENYWVAFYGKNNRIDHCSFLNKKNIGVLVAVILDDERSQENFHSIDHNYFGVRIPLASNGGEIIRVGVSEQCQYNSNTQITDNYFEHCDGETEIISIKSCRNVVRNNLFKECQGGVVLRHGNYNTVENNIFLGNNKEGTGGVRIINKGQWVINNLFYKCRGEGFRSPLSIMNGIPHSPANRYLEVSDAVICNNSFVDCAPISFCEGSDTERTVAPHEVKFLNNLFYNSRDSLLYHVYDNMSGISFAGNAASTHLQQQLTDGFTKTVLKQQEVDHLNVPVTASNAGVAIGDSLLSIGKTRLLTSLSAKQGLSSFGSLEKITTNALTACGAKWFVQKNGKKEIKKVNCKTVADVMQQLNSQTKNALVINLTGSEYIFDAPVSITTDVLLTAAPKKHTSFVFKGDAAPFLFQLKAGNNLQLSNLDIDLKSSPVHSFIITDTSGSSGHSNFSMRNCSISNFDGVFFSAAKASVCDSIIISQCSFKNISNDIFKFTEETGKKGYYNVEKLSINNCTFQDGQGQILSMLRTGNDESTMGPKLTFSNNVLNKCYSKNGEPIIYLYGTQLSLIEKNRFTDCNKGMPLIQYEDAVRAKHILRNNAVTGSGTIIKDKFVEAEH
ncbi:MAG: DUF4957 domain-containing protein [Bacteroidetes bacterium]|nr:DUF4957 domain-containing protein [Bacteroidota bacterium]